ncbi:MAG: radical SAM protein [Candidatus Odinarchaeota archaeon]|nr:radical SAM protein [Candidatus Odinarchaeota archaeon]
MWRFIRPDSVDVWYKEEVLDTLKNYYGILKGERYARYIVTKYFPVELEDLKEVDTESLWKVHDKASTHFSSFLRNVNEGEIKLSKLKKPKVSYLDLKIELSMRMLKSCNFCERRCGVDRSNGELGYCKVGAESRVASYFLHLGEEAPLVPSGTIFFSGCPFSCVFCQNFDISQRPYSGYSVGPQELAKIAESLASKGARNINYVGGDPIPNLHTILASMKYQKSNIAQLWNSNFYNSIESMKLLLDIIDIWLPDFKYGNDACALRLSKVPNYFEVVSRNHKMVHDHGGEMIVRHLVLPNHIECCTRPVLEWIAKNCKRALVNVMDQYRPMWKVVSSEDYPEIRRRLKVDEIEMAYKIAEENGLLWKAITRL